MRSGTPDAIDESPKIHGNILIGELLDASIILLPIAIGAHGEWGPMFENFLFHYTPRRHTPYNKNWPNANIMYEQAMNYPAPVGIVHTAHSVWKQSRPDFFYGRSYTAPTPKEYVQQQLGLAITKAIGFHLHRAKSRTGAHPKAPPVT